MSLYPRLLCAALLVLVPAACDFLEDPDEVQNSSNLAFIEAQIFASPDNRAPVEGVIMVVESDPDSERPFNGPDQSFTSDDTGFIRAGVFPGLDLEQQQTGPPATPFDAPPPLFFGDACVHFIHEGVFTTFSCGVTLGAGKVLNLGTVFLTQFGQLPGDEE
jgi:hypothetical protein